MASTPAARDASRRPAVQYSGKAILPIIIGYPPAWDHSFLGGPVGVPPSGGSCGPLIPGHQPVHAIVEGPSTLQKQTS